MGRCSWRFGRLRAALLALGVVASGLVTSAIAPPAGAATTFADPKFSDTVLIGGAAAPGTLNLPTVVRFAPDGRVFVAEQGGVVKEFDSLADPTPTTVLDISGELARSRDRGLLGMALDPNFTTKPYLYISFTYNHVLGDPAAAPKWPTWGCPDPPGPDGCTVSGRLSRFLIGANNVAGPEQPLIEAWCQQFDSHSIGAIQFGADGKLYLSGGDGANWDGADYGEYGGVHPDSLFPLHYPTPANPCGDPPGGVGAYMAGWTNSEGGFLRAQSMRRPANEPILLNGTIVRVDPDTGNALPDNPNASAADTNARRIVAYGLRNPFRFTIRPGTNDLWIGDVGQGWKEEINRVANPLAPTQNYGWPCYEGPDVQATTQSLNLNSCNALYAQGPAAVSSPVFAYQHGVALVTQGTDTCAPNQGSAVSAVSFYEGNTYPSKYKGALFFGDYVRNCLWAMLPGTDGLPDGSKVETFQTGTGTPVDLEIGPGGDLYYVDIGVDMSVSPPRTDLGAIHRIGYSGPGNGAPTAVLDADATSGIAPLTVHFDASHSTDPENDPLTYAWDLDGNGTYETGNVIAPSATYSAVKDVTVGLRVSDNHGNTATATRVIHAGNTPPVPHITTPVASLTWKVGDPINFSGGATDTQDGTLPASRLHWTLLLHHCHGADGCHIHTEAHQDGAASGTFYAPDHEAGSYIELLLEADDVNGLSTTASVVLQPVMTTLTVQTSPSGLPITADTAATSPVTIDAIVGHPATVAAPPTATLNGTTYHFDGWSDNGTATHSIIINGPTTVVAHYSPDTTVPTPPSVDVADASVVEGTGGANSAAVTITLSHPWNAPVNVEYATDDGTATAGSDYQAADGIVTFASGETSKTVTIPIVTDSTPEPDETFLVYLLGSDVATEGRTAATITIRNDDVATPPVVVADSHVTKPASGYRMVANDGGIFSFGDTPFYGSAAGKTPGSPIVGMTATATGNGYWMVAKNGAVFSFGDARPLGNRAGGGGAPMVGLAATRAGMGYWLATTDGSVFAYGNAANFGSLAGRALKAPIVGIAATPDGNGFWLVASDGGIFAFGNAKFYGSTGAIRLNRPIVGMTSTASGHGYDLVASDGGIFAFGDANFFGSTGAMRLNRPIVGMESTPSGAGYWLVATDGGIFAFGDAPFHGSTGAMKLNQPIAGMG